MLRLILEVAAACGFVIGSLYHLSDFMKLPVSMVGLAWMIAVRFMPPHIPKIGLFWVSYALLVYQLIAFHDLDACILEECKTEELYSYIALGSTGVFWFSMKDKNTTKYEIRREPKPEPNVPKVPRVEPKQPSFPSLNIRIQAENKPSKPFRLNMGEPLQPKWV